jgi:hypothetical protein
MSCLCLLPAPPHFTIHCPTAHLCLLITVHRRLSRHQLAPMLYLRSKLDAHKALQSLFGNHATVEIAPQRASLHIDEFMDVAEMREAGIV